jgi:two-component system KDP operon response regulator KdpE
VVPSAISDEIRDLRALDARADENVTAPFGVEELLARVRVALRRG